MGVASAGRSVQASRTRRKVLQSMTGYGRAAVQTPEGRVNVELRSTNHRYLEIEPRLPNGFAGVHDRLAELMRRHLRRGRVDITIFIQSDKRTRRRVAFDERLLRNYYESLVGLKARLGLKGPVTMDHVMALPQAVTVMEVQLSPQETWNVVRRAVELALKELVRARGREGERLVSDVRSQISSMEKHLRAVKARLPKALNEMRRQMRVRLKELVGPKTNFSRTQLREAVALLREGDVHEELVRIESHLAHARQTLANERLVGKQLDFIAQELMRETNTLGAKVNDAHASRRVVEMKGAVERIREQVQNLE